MHANGLNIIISVPKPYIEEVEDDDRSLAIYPLLFDPDGPIMIPVLLSIPGSALDSGENEAEGGRNGNGND